MTSNQVSLMWAMHLPSGNIHSGDGLKSFPFSPPALPWVIEPEELPV